MIKILTVTLSLFSSSIVVHITGHIKEVVMIKILTVTLSLFSSSVVVTVTH